MEKQPTEPVQPEEKAPVTEKSEKKKKSSLLGWIFFEIVLILAAMLAVIFIFDRFTFDFMFSEIETWIQRAYYSVWGKSARTGWSKPAVRADIYSLEGHINGGIMRPELEDPKTSIEPITR